jgi:hypothetical protein
MEVGGAQLEVYAYEVLEVLCFLKKKSIDLLGDPSSAILADRSTSTHSINIRTLKGNWPA